MRVLTSKHSSAGRLRAAGVALLCAAAVVSGLLAVPARAQGAWTPPQPTYRLNDFAGGDALSILPPGENGLVNSSDLALFETNGTRPAGSQDQLGPYANLLYNAQGLSDSQLSTYYDDESFGIPSGAITRTETPSAGVNVVIYRDTHDVPHIYGQNQQDVAFGAGYAAAEDRLFMIDVLRHYGSGTLSAFLGPSCADEQMDHDALLLGGYTTAQKKAQIDSFPARFGALGKRLRQMAYSFIDGINAYISAAEQNPQLMPAEYPAVTGAPPQPWSVTNIIDLATLLGGIFGKGGGSELRNAALLQYLQHHSGDTAAASMFSDFKEQNDADAPTTVVGKKFPYEIPATVDPATTAMPDNAAAPLRGGPTDTTSGCNPSANPQAMAILASLLQLPHAMSNALLVDGAHSADGHPIAVFGPQVGYYAPQILMEEDLHASDGSYDVEGASFPGTNFIVELGRGRNFAWSATSAETDNVDQRLELICDPAGGTPSGRGKYYMFNGQCIAMQHHVFKEIAYTKPGGQGEPVVIKHHIWYTVHGVVQGWTRANHGQPVAVVNQRSTYGHEVDSGIGFLRFGMPAETHDVTSWMQSASDITFTFNWFYVDTQNIGYYQSGLLPIRPSDVDPNLPTWGTGIAEWQGYLGFSQHAHEVGSPTGYITSWNNKGAPQFSAADDKFSWGPVQRVQSLNAAIGQQLSQHGGKLTRANLVTAMETAASVDLSGSQVLPYLLPFVAQRSEPAGVQAMLAELQQWLNDGAPRRKAAPGDAQYADASGVAAMDELFPRLNEALFNSILGAGGVYQTDSMDAGYNVFPMGFAGTPNGGGSHSGSSYQDGFEGYDWKVLRTLDGMTVSQPFSSTTASRLCGSGLSGCGTAIDAALQATYNALVSANGGSTDVSSWTQDTATSSLGTTMPQYDDIEFSSVGLVGQPAIDWQNRPTFQQVVEFPLG